jgi:hypothetical protein
MKNDSLDSEKSDNSGTPTTDSSDRAGGSADSHSPSTDLNDNVAAPGGSANDNNSSNSQQDSEVPQETSNDGNHQTPPIRPGGSSQTEGTNPSSDSVDSSDRVGGSADSHSPSADLNDNVAAPGGSSQPELMENPDEQVGDEPKVAPENAIDAATTPSPEDDPDEKDVSADLSPDEKNVDGATPPVDENGSESPAGNSDSESMNQLGAPDGSTPSGRERDADDEQPVGINDRSVGEDVDPGDRQKLADERLSCGRDTPAGRAYADSDDPVRDSQDNLQPIPGHYVVDAHGNPNGVHIGDELLTPNELADVMRADSNYPQGTPIFLMSCETGKEPEGGGPIFAQQLSDDLGVPVVAPSELAWANGAPFAASGQQGRFGLEPKHPPDGEFLQFLPGGEQGEPRSALGDFTDGASLGQRQSADISRHSGPQLGEKDSKGDEGQWKPASDNYVPLPVKTIENDRGIIPEHLNRGDKKEGDKAWSLDRNLKSPEELSYEGGGDEKRDEAMSEAVSGINKLMTSNQDGFACLTDGTLDATPVCIDRNFLSGMDPPVESQGSFRPFLGRVAGEETGVLQGHCFVGGFDDGGNMWIRTGGGPNGDNWRMCNDEDSLREVLALPKEWNGDKQFVEYELPEGHVIGGVGGEAAPVVTSATDEGDNTRLEGGGFQVWIPEDQLTKATGMKVWHRPQDSTTEDEEVKT